MKTETWVRIEMILVWSLVALLLGLTCLMLFHSSNLCRIACDAKGYNNFKYSIGGCGCSEKASGYSDILKLNLTLNQTNE